MSEIKHTPGPWVIDPRYSHDVQTPDGNDICSVFDAEQVGEEWEIAGNIPWSEEIAEANARLIAAAPELLEAAKEVMSSMVSTGEYVGGCNQLRAAIAKAEGRS